MSEEIHIGLNKETGKFEQVQAFPEEAVTNLLKGIEPTTVRTFILTNMSTSLKPDLATVDMVEKNIKEAIEVWSMKKHYDDVSTFIQAIVRNNTYDANRCCTEKEHDANYNFMNVYNKFAATMVPHAIVDAFKKQYEKSYDTNHGDNTRTRTSTV